MLDTTEFFNLLIKKEFTHLCVVPCSFASELINASINNSHKIEYIPCASEAIACSVAVGLTLSGKRPIIIIQSSGLTNMGSCLTSLAKPYDINLTIIVSWRTFKPGESEIQHSHLATNIKGLIKSYGFSSDILSTNNSFVAVDQIDRAAKENKILLLQKNSFAKQPLKQKHQLSIEHLPKRSLYIKKLLELKSKEHKLIGTTGNMAREIFGLDEECSTFLMTGNMGGALSIGLGAAMGGNKSIVCGGDAEFTMHMGGITTAGRYKDIKGSILYIVFDNFANKSTGGQRSYQEHINYIKIAEGSGFEAYPSTIRDVKSFEVAFRSLSNSKLGFIHLLCSFDKSAPRPPSTKIIESKHIFKNL